MTLLPTSIPDNLTNVSLDGNQTQGNYFDCHIQRSEWAFTVIPVYILLISVLGIVFNVFVLMVFCLHKKACTVPEIFFSNLAAADLLLMFSLPFYALYVAKKYDWTFGEALCKLVSLSMNMYAYCSIYLLVLINIDRYLAVVHPLSNDRIRRPFYAKLGSLLVWILGLLLGVPTLLYKEVSHQGNRDICHMNISNFTTYLVTEGINFMFAFIIPICIISICTVKIIQTLCNRLTEGLKTQKMEQKAITLVLAVFLAFLICWVPFFVVRIVEVLYMLKFLSGCNVIKIMAICQQVFIYLAFFNSVLNPFLYVIVGKSFRIKVKEVFNQCCN